MHVVLAGRMKMRIREATYDLGPGGVVLIPPKTLHSVATTKRVTMFVIHFREKSIELQQWPIGPALRPETADFEAINRHVDEIRQILTSGGTAAPTVAAGHLQIIIGLLRREATSTIPQSAEILTANWSNVQSALQYMQDHMHEPDLSIRRVADSAGLSYNYFSAVFHRVADTTAVAYLRTLRVEEAKSLLLNTTLRVSEIASRVGFRTTEYFTKAFKSVELMPPSVWRKRNSAAAAQPLHLLASADDRS